MRQSEGVASEHMGARPPRVLVLTPNRLQPHTGGGVVLRNLFQGFPRANMFALHIDDTDPGAGLEGHQEHRLPISWLRPRLGALGRLLWRFAVQWARAPSRIRWGELRGLLIEACEFRLTAELDAQIRRFSPEVIYAWVGDSLWARLVESCARRYRLPYVIHFMDNHLDLEGDTPLQRAVSAELKYNLSRVIVAAERIFTISSAMGAVYSERFRKPFDVFHGLIDGSSWPWPPAQQRAEPFTLAFAGSVEAGQLEGLRDVARAVERVAARGRRIRLVLYLTGYYRSRVEQAFSSFAHVEYRLHPDFSGLREALQAADVLVLAYGHSEQCTRFYKYSFATKTVPYMMAGRCILAYGPQSIEPIAYLERGGWAYVVCEEGPEALACSIERLADDPSLRERIARAAFEAGLVEHDLEVNARRFRVALTEIAGIRAHAGTQIHARDALVRGTPADA